MTRRGFTPYFAVFNRAGTAAGDRRFFPTGPPRDCGRTKSVHSQIDVLTHTGDSRFEFAYQVTDDPENWPDAATFTPIGSTVVTTTGVSASSGFDDISAGMTKARMRPGVATRNETSGARVELAWVATKFDFRES